MPWKPLTGEGDELPQRLRLPLDRLLRNLEAPRARTVRSVFEGWEEVVGESLAAHVAPISLRRGRLAVAVPDPAWATQLRYLETELLTRLAEAFGPDEVTAIDIRVRPAR